MQLTIGERFALANILPGEGDFVTMTLVKNLRSRLDVTEAEAETCEMESWITPNGNTAWRARTVTDDDGNPVQLTPAEALAFLDVETEIEVRDRVVSIVEEQLKTLEGSKKLTEPLLSLYQKFIEDPKDAERREGLHEIQQEASA